MENRTEILTSEQFLRLANNFYIENKIEVDLNRFNTDAGLVNYILSHPEDVKKRQRVAFVCICLNAPYWEFARPMIEGAKRLFLPGHDVDFFLWSDMPKTKDKVVDSAKEYLKASGLPAPEQQALDAMNALGESIEGLYKMDKVTVFDIEPIEWPMPTLLRYHTFLQQEEKLKEYDYIFYCDVDMSFVNVVGDEILGESLTTGTNPMYWLDKTMWMPTEPNPSSTAYIKRPGQVIKDGEQKRFQPQYYAGGFQGGKSDEFIKAMKVMKKNIDKDLNMNYISLWNDESHWNKYIFENIDPEKLVVLNPSYIYPDSLHNEYYIPRWGKNYMPKLVTLTKKFSLKKLTPEEQAQITRMQGVK